MNLIQEINEQGITIQLADADHLALIPREKVTPELISKVKASKQELLRALRGTQDMGIKKNVEPGADMEVIKVYSRILRREVFVSWDAKNPGTVFFDGLPYTVDEIAKLKNKMPLTPDELRLVHQGKGSFEGKITSFWKEG